MDAREQETVIRVFGRHLLGVGVTYHTVGRPDSIQRIVYSGTLLRIGSMTSWFTAGHVIAEINSLYSDPNIIVRSCRLIDCFGLDAVSSETIPFDWRGADQALQDSDGVDFGCVRVSDFYVRLLEKNHILAIEERNWRKSPTDLDQYFVLGFPVEMNSPLLKKDGSIKIHPVLQRIERRYGKPEEAGFGALKMPVFLGEIVGDNLRSLGGMSGGPIFGLRSGDPSVYWIVGILRSQKGRLITGCSLAVAGEILDGAMERVLQEPSDPS